MSGFFAWLPSPSDSPDIHFVVHEEIETSICDWWWFPIRDSFLRVLTVCDLQDRIQWWPALTTQSTHPLSHWHRRQLYNYPVLTSSHVSSIRPLSGDLSDKSRHGYEHLPLSSHPLLVTRDLVTDGTFNLNWSWPPQYCQQRLRGRRQLVSVTSWVLGKDSRWHTPPVASISAGVRGAGWHQQMLMKLTFCLLFYSPNSTQYLCLDYAVLDVGSNNLAQILSNDNEVCQGQNYFRDSYYPLRS